jgi:uncharacterized glyoxalase superfamily protein PhnB
VLTNRSIPPVTVIPTLSYLDVTDAARWLCDAFGFTVRLRIGDHRVQLDAGDGAVVATDGLCEGGMAAKDHTIMIRVEDVDAHFEHARRQGAEIIRELETYIFGERQYTAADPAGHLWTFTQSVQDVDPESWGGVAG